MRAVLQRVNSARVTVAGSDVGVIDHGIVALVGVAVGDEEADGRYVADKIADLRLFDPVEDGGPERSLVEVGGSALVISQFTLLGDCRKGRRPSWSEAAPPDEARTRFEAVVARLRQRGVPVETGIFRAEMAVQLINDGPFTVLLDSRKAF
ncbi:MAG: D-aminoacyl-tRNA deacylase [Capsulimonadales bacterium]|nr:D-aminoacyl-tRNA deacylase [Capsulimonadales bacterium]